MQGAPLCSSYLEASLAKPWTSLWSLLSPLLMMRLPVPQYGPIRVPTKRVRGRPMSARALRMQGITHKLTHIYICGFQLISCLYHFSLLFSHPFPPRFSSSLLEVLPC